MAVGAASITPKSITIGNLLEDHHPFFVPRYQRSYSWDTDQVEEFIQDIARMMESEPTARSHFFGGLVAIEHTDHTRPRPHRYEIVDGQQRLATFVLALAHIVRSARKIHASALDAGDTSAGDSAKTLADDTEDRFLRWKRSNVREGRTDVLPRLELSRADDFEFQALLEGRKVNPLRESHHLLLAANRLVGSGLIDQYANERLVAKEKIEALERLRTALVDQSHVIYMISGSRDRAYQLFSVLNDRGRSLADADLLRSYTLELLEGWKPQQDAVAEMWDDMLSTPARAVSEFFKAYYPSVTGQRASAPLFGKLASEFFSQGQARTGEEAERLVGQVGEFQKELEIYLLLLEGRWPYEETTEVSPQKEAVTKWQKDRLWRLVKVLKHELALPLLLAAARRVKERQLADLVYMLEVFAFRYKNVCGGHAGPPSSAYYKCAKEIREVADAGVPGSFADLRLRLTELLDGAASDEQFRDDLVNRLQYNRSAQRANIRELLTTLEDHHAWLARGASGKPVPDMTMVHDLDLVTIEHIYPLRPASVNIDPALDLKKNELGNLAFFGPGDNNDAGNKPFVTKRDTYYKTSRIAMTSNLAEFGQWTIVEFQARQAKILDHACAVFVI